MYGFVICIPWFRKKKLGQIVRREGLKTHYCKNGTPTCGGIIFVISSTLIFIVYASILRYPPLYVIIILMPLVLYSIIGFIDDGLIIKEGKNDGLKANFKVLLEIIWASIYFYLYLKLNNNTIVKFFNYSLDLKFLYGVLVLLMFVSSTNSFNITDGVDGLSGGLMVICLISVIILAGYKNNQALVLFSLILLGSLLSYLCYNFGGAKIFMGDSGSLALGATLANMFILLKMELLLIISGIVFIIETLSVIVQVIYFKLTKGKRIFLMSPIHHHFELKGLNEKKIDYLFWIIGFLAASLTVYLGIKYY